MARKSAPVVLAAALVLASCGLAVAAIVGSTSEIGSALASSQIASRAETRSYHDVTGWHVRYPAAFHIEVSEQELRLSIVEVTIGSFQSRPGVVVHTSRGNGNVRALPPLDRAGRFPVEGVAFRVVSDQGAPPGLQENTRLHYPLTLARFRPSRAGPEDRLLYNATTGETEHAVRYHGAPRSLVRYITVRGVDYALVVWVGPKASAEQRRALARMIASLRF